MPLDRLIDTYGYWVILVGTLLEGETILILGGFAAYQGYLALPGVILMAFMGGLCGDQLFFSWGGNMAAESWPDSLPGRAGSIRSINSWKGFKPG
jgi:membrane protein DedA with SNARE-associated domain